MSKRCLSERCTSNELVDPNVWMEIFWTPYSTSEKVYFCEEICMEEFIRDLGFMECSKCRRMISERHPLNGDESNFVTDILCVECDRKKK